MIMTDKQRDFGRIMAIGTLLLILLTAMLSGCAPSLYKNNNKINITHVLAVTEMGDTLKIPINAIRPNVIYNVMGYSYGRYSNYHRPYYNSTYDYYPYNLNQMNNNNNINYSTSRPAISNNSNSSGISSGSNTSGGSGNPIAVNPVTSGGGGKKKNN